MKRVFGILTVALVACTACASAQAADWGNLKGAFVYDGDPPEPEAVNINKDQAYCGRHDLVDESLVVNPSNKGVKNVAVWLYIGRGESEPEVHPDYVKQADEPVVLDNSKCRFEPRITTLWNERPLVVANSDPIGHNTKVDLFANVPFNDLIPAGGKITKTLPEEERIPAPVGCNIHPWMQGYLLVKGNPYMAVTDENGQFEIKNLPAGDWTLQVWHEAGYVDDVTVGGQKGDWSRGRVEVTIKPGETTDLGGGQEIAVSPAVFE